MAFEKEIALFAQIDEQSRLMVVCVQSSITWGKELNKRRPPGRAECDQQ